MKLRRGIFSLAVLAMLAAACTGNDPAVTTTVTASPEDTTVATTVPTASGLVAPPVRHPATSGAIYFVMTDRFKTAIPPTTRAESPVVPSSTDFYPRTKASIREEIWQVLQPGCRTSPIWE